jgi:hypothetical protein
VHAALGTELGIVHFWLEQLIHEFDGLTTAKASPTA